jgi:thiol-disulfide isomerase/thioredoxin
MGMKSFLWFGCAVAVALFAGGCGRVENKPASAELPVLRKASVWTLKDVDGREVKSTDFKGKVVVVDFWATWCPPCRKEIPHYVALQEKYRAQGLVILGFSLDELPPAEVKTFGQQFKINYPLIMADGATAEAFGGVEGLPTAFVIDREGNIRHVKLGLADHEAYEKLIASLL